MLGHLAHLAVLARGRTRSVSPENFTGAKGAGATATEGLGANASRDLGPGWKVSPAVAIEAGQTFTLADLAGPGTVQHLWLTPTGRWRMAILRIYYDDHAAPAVECPLADFFCMGWQRYAPLSSLAICVNPGSAFNCYWPMPFARRFRMTIENLDAESMVLYYQLTFAEHDDPLPPDTPYFHAQFRRSNPLDHKTPHTLLDGVRGRGQYVGTSIAWQSNSTGWWGEGEIKFFLDGDALHPTICGTGTEDYFCGSYNFENPHTRQYQEYCTPYAGLHQVIRPDGVYQSQQRFAMYRWHIPDPIRFDHDLKVTIQALGWRSGGRYLPLRDDIASVACWYQLAPAAPFPPLPDRDGLEVL